MAERIQYEYEELCKNNYDNYDYQWFLGDKKVEVQYGMEPAIEALKVIGKDGWQLVSREKDGNYIVMREVKKVSHKSEQ